MESRKPTASLTDASSLFDRPLSPSRFSYLSRRRSSQSPSILSSEGITSPVSCVTRETSQDDCARHRFIVWAAVRRNSCGRMTASEKLECPLLRCRKRFSDHETMLMHLADCEHLASGEYWCYEHMRPERFDDLKCRRCLGHPSKRRKMLSMAKNFFQSLGHKPRKGGAFEDDYDADTFLSSPSHVCLGGDASHVGVELPATEICEIDSREVQPSAHYTTDRGIDPQALLVPELNSAAAYYGHEGLGDHTAKPALQLTTQGIEQAHHSPFRPPPRPVSTVSRSKGLSPSSSVRSTNSTNSTDSNVTAASNVSSLVSPASVWSGTWSLASSAATNITNADELFDGPEFLPGQPDQPQAEDCYINQDTLSELPAELPPAELGLDMSPDAFFFSFDPAVPTDVSYDADLVLTDDIPGPVDLRQTEDHGSGASCSETTALVASAWDALEQHVSSSTLKIQHLRENPLACQLRSQSTKATALAGLRVLATLLNGDAPTSTEGLLCFVHLVYALSLTLRQDDATTRSCQLFLEALSYRDRVSPEDRHAYTEVVTEIWQPIGLPQSAISEYMAQLPRLPDHSAGKQPDYDGRSLDLRIGDAMMTAARQFLDELEAALVFGEMPTAVEILTSNLYMKHLQDSSLSDALSPLTATISGIISCLSQRFPGAPYLGDKLNGIYQSVNSGGILSVRRAELELLRAGKGSMTRTVYLDQFAPTVKQLCDSMYQQLVCETAKREAYHFSGIALIEGMLHQWGRPRQKLPSPGCNLDGSLLGDLTSPLGSDAMALFVNTEEPANVSGHEAKMVGHVPALTDSGNSPSDDGMTLTESAPGPSSPPVKTDAGACCEICGYRPKGDPQWFRGSMAKHKKLQHSTKPPQVFKCPYPGCNSAYKSRPDNLRQHQIEKNHFVDPDQVATRRPSKRKKLAET